MAEEYIYAAARIHANEVSLLSFHDIEQLLESRNYDEAVKTLCDKGFGDPAGFENYEQMLKYESEKTWNFIGELFDDLSVFDVLKMPYDFHNLKASIKAVCTDSSPDGLFVSGGTVNAEKIYDAVVKQDFSDLPDHLRQTAQKALSALLQTKDGQLCDIIIDKAQLEAMISASKHSSCSILKEYADLYASQANVKIAVRGVKTGKNADFYDEALADCESIDAKRLKAAALGGFDKLCEYLQCTRFAGAVENLKESPSAFEKYCDNLIMDSISTQKYDSFSLGPAVAYILARENEIKALRIVLSAKKNGLSAEAVKERLRNMYV